MSLMGGLNPLLLFNLAEIIASDLRSEPEPEAYMGYALYDADSNLYERGKILLSKRSENKHEELKEKLYIQKSGHVETFLVNETNEDVWPACRRRVRQLPHREHPTPDCAGNPL
jgi:hypothetical protein